MNPIVIRFRYEMMRNEAHAQFHETVIALFGKYPAEEAGIKALADRYALLFANEKAALDTIVKSAITDELEAQDQVRDGLYRGFSNAVKSYRNHFDAGKRQAAEKLDIALKSYGNLSARPLDQETIAINDLHTTLQEADHAACVKALGLDDWLAELSEANRAFSAMMTARYAEKAGRAHADMRELRADVDRVFRALLDFLEVLVKAEGSEKNTAFLAELNAVMRRYEQLLAQQKGMREKSVRN